MATSSPSRRWLQLAAGVGLSGLFLWLALRGEDWDAIGASLTAVRYEYLVLAAAIGLYAIYVRCQRWRLLLEHAVGTGVAMTPIFSATAIGFMANMVLPFRIGEFVRPYLVSRHTTVTLSTALATSVLERVLDLLAIFAFGVWVVSTIDVPDVVRRLTWVAGVAVVMLFGGVIVLHLQRARLLPIVDRVWLRLPGHLGERIMQVEHEFLDGMATITNLRVLAMAVAWSLYIWLLIAIGFALGLLATRIDVSFFGAGVTLATIVALAVSIPGAPGFVGQFEWACKVALEGVYGVEGAKAVGYSLVVHATQFVAQVGLGVVYLAREGLSLGELRRIGEETEESG